MTPDLKPGSAVTLIRGRGRTATYHAAIVLGVSALDGNQPPRLSLVTHKAENAHLGGNADYHNALDRIVDVVYFSDGEYGTGRRNVAWMENLTGSISGYYLAEAAHEANRILCLALNDTSQPPFDEAPEWQIESALKGVFKIHEDPSTTPAQSHASWLSEKELTGWTWGPVKDPAKKQHPCMVPYEALPMMQRLKDCLYGLVVRAALNRSLHIAGQQETLAEIKKALDNPILIPAPEDAPKATAAALGTSKVAEDLGPLVAFTDTSSEPPKGAGPEAITRTTFVDEDDSQSNQAQSPQTATGAALSFAKDTAEPTYLVYLDDSKEPAITKPASFIVNRPDGTLVSLAGLKVGDVIEDGYTVKSIDTPDENTTNTVLIHVVSPVDPVPSETEGEATTAA
jgi:hypothetical protein